MNEQVPDAEPLNQCSGCDGTGANDDPENPGERVVCEVCDGEGDQDRHLQQLADAAYYADLADAASY